MSSAGVFLKCVVVLTTEQSWVHEAFAVTEEERHELAKRLIADLRRRLLDLSTRESTVEFQFRSPGPAGSGGGRVAGRARSAAGRREDLRVSRPFPRRIWYPRTSNPRNLNSLLKRPLLSESTMLINFTFSMIPMCSRQLKLKLERRVGDRVRDELGMPPFESHETMTVDEWARKNGINPSFELPRVRQFGFRFYAAKSELQLLLFPKEMERKLRGIEEGARLALSEMGINILFMAFGFLEWTESESSARVHLAPLLLHPLQMDQKLVRQVYRYYVRSTGDDTEINYTLQERLRQDFGIELPLLEDDEDPKPTSRKLSKPSLSSSTGVFAALWR